jgi:redox-sensitive bicupin YhaK (pirin superfamily)
MSYREGLQPVCEKTAGLVELEIRPKTKDLGEFSVRRVLPASDRQMVGPFIFFDHMGPAEFPPGQGIQVRPHPHIGISTITYLFDGEIMHRDSLGYLQPIQAGAVNLMTAGRGIVHSERAGSDLDQLAKLHGIQSWMALPKEMEEIEPAFAHTPAAELPEIEQEGVTVRVIIGTAYGQTSPVKAYASTLYLDCVLENGSQLTLPTDYEELGFYVVSGQVTVADREVGDGVMLVACPGAKLSIKAEADSRLMVVGGESLGERHIWWNFVSSSEARMAQAKEEWARGGFTRIEGDDEFIPLPG